MIDLTGASYIDHLGLGQDEASAQIGAALGPH